MRLALVALSLFLASCAATPDLVYGVSDGGSVAEAGSVDDAGAGADVDAAANDAGAEAAASVTDSGVVVVEAGGDASWNTCPVPPMGPPALKCCPGGLACSGDCHPNQCDACATCGTTQVCCTHGASTNVTCAPPGGHC